MYKLQLSFQNLIFCKLGSHQLYCSFLAWADGVVLLTGRPAGRLADFAWCWFCIVQLFYRLCDKWGSLLHEECGHIYVACTTVLLIFNVISVVVDSYLLDFLVLLKLGRLAELYWFTAHTSGTALMCDKGVLTFSWSYWIFLLTPLSIFALNMWMRMRKTE